MQFRNLRMATRLFLSVITLNAMAVQGAFAGEPDAERGQYLTTILGCGGCHTEGALFREPYGTWLAGSKIGVAYTDFENDDRPGLVFPSNLTSDDETGLGKWSQKDIERAIRRGVNHNGEYLLSVMPWANYSLLKDEDVSDIAAYLMTLPAVFNEIPKNTKEGEHGDKPYVRIGVYLFTPETTPAGTR